MRKCFTSLRTAVYENHCSVVSEALPDVFTTWGGVHDKWSYLFVYKLFVTFKFFPKVFLLQVF